MPRTVELTERQYAAVLSALADAQPIHKDCAHCAAWTELYRGTFRTLVGQYGDTPDDYDPTADN